MADRAGNRQAFGTRISPTVALRRSKMAPMSVSDVIDLRLRRTVPWRHCWRVERSPLRQACGLVGSFPPVQAPCVEAIEPRAQQPFD